MINFQNSKENNNKKGNILIHDQGKKKKGPGGI